MSLELLAGGAAVVVFLGELGGTREWWLGRKDLNLEMAISKTDALACSRGATNPISLEFINISKHSNFENRTEFAESGAPERNEPFGEE